MKNGDTFWLPSVLCVAAICILQSTVRADHLQDLREAETIGLPYCAHWTVKKGFTFKWHVDQVRVKKHRFVPSIYLPPYLPAGADTALAQNVYPYGADLKWVSDNGVPLCIRTDNIGTFGFDSYRYRLYTDATGKRKNAGWTEANVPLRWRYNAGKPDDEKEFDPLAPPDAWIAEGRAIGEGKYLRMLQRACPKPARVIHLQNNEAAEDKAAKYFAEDGISATTPAKLMDVAKIAARSQRVADLVASYPPGTPGDQLKLDMALGRKRLFDGYFAALRDTLPAAWKTGFRATAYGCLTDPKVFTAPRVGFDQIGYSPAAICQQGALPPWYLLGPTDCSVISFGFPLNWTLANTWLRKNDPSFVPGMSIKINKDGAIGAAKAGLHEPLTPERWAGAVLWQVWALHERATPFEVRDFWESSSAPGDRLFANADLPDLQRLGVPELATATKGDYFEPVMTGVDRICENPTIRRFWIEGTPVLTGGTPLGEFFIKKYIKIGPLPAPGDTDRRARLLDCPLNDPPSKWEFYATGSRFAGTVKVWAVATEIADEHRCLIYAWSPFKIAEPVDVTVPGYGTFPVSVADPRGNYIVVHSPQPGTFVAEPIER